MALRRYCDKCGVEVANGRYLVIEIKPGSGRNGLRGELSERDLCEKCASKVYEFITSWVEVFQDE